MSDKTKTIVKERDPYRWVMLLLIVLVYVVVLGFINTSFNLLISQIAGVQEWEPAQATLVVGAFPMGMMFFAFIAGNVIDRFSVKKLMGICLIFIGILVLLRGFLTGFGVWYALMFIFGIVSAFYQPIITKVVALWFPPEQIVVANGFTTAASPIGQFTANFLALTMVANLSGGWRQLYIICGIIVFVLMIVWWIFARERKNEDSATISQDAKDNTSLGQKLKGVLSDPFVWCMIIADAFFLGFVYAGGTYQAYALQNDPLWVATVNPLHTGYPSLASNICSMTAYLVTPLIFAKLSPSGKGFKIWMFITSILSPILLFIGYYSYDLTTAMVMFGLSGFAFGGIVPGPKVLMLRRKSVTGPRAGTAYGLMLTVERIFITVCTNVLGAIILAQTEGQSHVNGNACLLMLVATLACGIAFLYDYSKKKKTGVSGEV